MRRAAGGSKSSSLGPGRGDGGALLGCSEAACCRSGLFLFQSSHGISNMCWAAPHRRAPTCQAGGRGRGGGHRLCVVSGVSERASERNFGSRPGGPGSGAAGRAAAAAARRNNCGGRQRGLLCILNPLRAQRTQLSLSPILKSVLAAQAARACVRRPHSPVALGAFRRSIACVVCCLTVDPPTRSHL